MASEPKVAPDNFTVRVGEDEIARIFGLKQSLELADDLVEDAARYLSLGWRLAAVNGGSQSDLGVDFCQPAEVWRRRLQDLLQGEARVGLAVHTGAASRLFVLEVRGEEGGSHLNSLGEWRSACVARGPTRRERHFFLLPPQRQPSATRELTGLPLTVFGEGGTVLLPPSQEPDTQERWEWLTPPWEQLPGFPGSTLWEFLQRRNLPARPGEDGTPPDVPSWEELFRFVSSYEGVLQALLAPSPTPTEYYQRLLRAAWGAGLTHPQVLRGLLWHAPHGDAKQRPERWEYLQTLAAGASDSHSDRGPPWRPEPREAAEGKRFGALLDDGPPSPWGKPASMNLGLSDIMSVAQHLGRERGRREFPGAVPQVGFADMMQQAVGEVLKVMEDRVILERSRYEAMLFEIGKLSSRAAELESRLADCEQRLRQQSNGKKAGEESVLGFEKPPPWLTPEGNYAIRPQEPEPPAPLSSGQVIRDYLARNPDLGRDSRAVQMLQFCLKNYIDLNPENSGLSFKEKLEKAGKLAREFLGKEQAPEV